MEFQVPNTLAEEIANYLGDRIMTGRIEPGQRLQEASIAQDLGVSRASVKEAFYTLERWHLLEIQPRKGAHASLIDAHHASELYDVYMHLLMMLVERLCERWRPEDRDGLLASIQQVRHELEASPPDVGRVVEASFQAMEACSEVVGNPYLSEALRNFKPAVSRAFYFSADRYRQDLDQTGQLFERLAQAVLERDAPTARQMVATFAETQKNLIAQALSGTPLRTAG